MPLGPIIYSRWGNLIHLGMRAKQSRLRPSVSIIPGTVLLNITQKTVDLTILARAGSGARKGETVSHPARMSPRRTLRIGDDVPRACISIQPRISHIVDETFEALLSAGNWLVEAKRLAF